MVLTILKQLKFSEDWQISSNELQSTDFTQILFFYLRGILYFLYKLYFCIKEHFYSSLPTFQIRPTLNF